MSYLNTYDLAQAASFRHRILAALVNRAGITITEPLGDMTPVHHDKRRGLAVETLNNPEGVVGRFVWPVLANPTIAGKGLDATDGELDYQIAQVWDSLSGVTTADQQA